MSGKGKRRLGVALRGGIASSARRAGGRELQLLLTTQDGTRCVEGETLSEAAVLTPHDQHANTGRR